MAVVLVILLIQITITITITMLIIRIMIILILIMIQILITITILILLISLILLLMLILILTQILILILIPIHQPRMMTLLIDYQKIEKTAEKLYNGKYPHGLINPKNHGLHSVNSKLLLKILKLYGVLDILTNIHSNVTSHESKRRGSQNYRNSWCEISW